MKKLVFLVIALISLSSCNKMEKAKIEDITFIDSIYVESSSFSVIYDASNIQTFTNPSHYKYRYEITLSKDSVIKKDTVENTSKKLDYNIGDSIYIKRR